MPNYNFCQKRWEVREGNNLEYSFSKNVISVVYSYEHEMILTIA